MDELDFLKEEVENVKRTLDDTLRHDYEPGQSQEYHKECISRQTAIAAAVAKVTPADHDQIVSFFYELQDLSLFVSLIERSHLGEFSWPFARELRRIAESLFQETNMANEKHPPIVHIYAEGGGYQILNELRTSFARTRSFLNVAFPRTLKHHVLLHTILGHELGHTALTCLDTKADLTKASLDHILNSRVLKSDKATEDWIKDPSTPKQLKSYLAPIETAAGKPYALSAESRESWMIELTCDLFGLAMFGPSFLASSRLILRREAEIYLFNAHNNTHPPYAVRHKLLVRALRILNYDEPITSGADGDAYLAEQEFLAYIQDDPYDAWADIFTDAEVTGALTGIRKVFAADLSCMASRPKSGDLVELVHLLKTCVPPVIVTIDKHGFPNPQRTPISHTLYAGWIVWIGRQHLKLPDAVTFETLNRLCDHALLQERAIDTLQ